MTRIRNPKLELLAPAKDKECAIMAIDCGADAVYLACEKFGARAKAGNSLADIKEVIDYAHVYRAKVYITINTILSDKEVEEAVKTIHELYEMGADAIIIQDMGILKHDLPPIAIYASTQCNNRTLEQVQFLQKIGFQKAILARELSLAEIKNICQNTDLEIETFIHGALCVSYSGRCYMSYSIGGRSANRGECAQPCRKKYTLIDDKGEEIAKDKHLLSLKDLNASKLLKELIEAGVTSFKIEGRLKDVNYIKNVVSFYRQRIDRLIEGTEYVRSSVGHSEANQAGFVPNPNKTFNRGYSEYFLDPNNVGRNKHIASFDSPKSIGEKIGTVVAVKNRSFMIDKNILNNADGICFFDREGVLRGTQVNKIQNGWVHVQSSEHMEKGTQIYRNHDFEFLKKLKSIKFIRKIPVEVSVLQSQDSLVFVINDGDNNRAELAVKNKFELANNKEKSLDNLKKQLCKLGDTEFSCECANVDLQEAYFIPVGELNSIRRELIDKFREVRSQSYERAAVKRAVRPESHPEKELFFDSNVANKYAKEFYESCGAKVSEMAAETGQSLEGKKLMTTKHCLKYSHNLCPKDGKKHSFKEPFYLVDEKNKHYRLNFDCKECVMEIIQD